MNQSALKIRFSVKKLGIGVLLAALCFAACCFAGASNSAKLVFPILFLIVSFVKLECSNVVSKLLVAVWGIAATFITVFCCQLLLNESTFSLGVSRILMNMAICAIVMGLLYVITAHLRLSVALGMTILMIFTAANYFVFKFRGSELCPADFLSIGTAMAVAGRYTFEIDAPFLYAVLMGVLYIFAVFCIDGVARVNAPRNRIICTAFVGIMALFLYFGSGHFTAYHFLQSGSVSNGYFLNFLLEVKESIVVRPDGYSQSALRELELQYDAGEPDSADSDDPVIIAIMSESFTDLSVLGSEVKTNTELLPYFHSLSENVIKGNALSSVIGGGTANSEYEFLSGNTMGFLPMGSIVYQQFIPDEPYTMVSYLKELGYTTVATHPADAKNWLRYSVYPKMGFDEMYFIEDYPQQDLLRGFISDQEMYEQIIRWFEEYDETEKLFLFGVSMQNHGFYFYEGDDFENTVKLEGYSGNYPDVEQYLTILQQSDLALEYLISYFEKVERDVVILLFGDHFPKLDGQFYEEVHGGVFETLDEQMLQYTIPFFIWTNYDIEEREIELTSINYLSNLLLQAAGLELPEYNAFLADAQHVIPAINSYGFYSRNQGHFVSFDQATGQEAEMIQKYQILQYNNLFGKEETSDVFFYVYDSSATKEHR